MSNKLINYTGYLLCFMMLVLPFKFQWFKLILIIILILYSFRKNIKINTKCLLWSFLYIIAGAFPLCYGMILNNPAPHKYIPVYILWPILFTFISFLIDKDYFISLLNVFKYYLLIIILSGIIAFIYFNINGYQENDFLGYYPSIRPGYPFLAITGGIVIGFIFLYFYQFTFFLLSNKNTPLDWINLILGIFFIFFTSRRILFFNFILSFIVILLLLPFVKKKEIKKEIKLSIKKRISFLVIFFFIISMIIQIYGIFDFSELFEFLQSSVGDDTTDPRVEQLGSLIEGWMNAPLLGNGTGVNASVVRSELPGNYELSYVALLFERGLIGVSLYCILYIVLIYNAILAINIVDEKRMISLIVSINLFMIANATNPYLNAFDYIWFIFILLVPIRLLSKNENLCTNKSLQ